MNGKRLTDLAAERGSNAPVTFGDLTQIFDVEHKQELDARQKKDQKGQAQSQQERDQGLPEGGAQQTVTG